MGGFPLRRLAVEGYITGIQDLQNQISNRSGNLKSTSNLIKMPESQNFELKLRNLQNVLCSTLPEPCVSLSH